MKAATVRLLAQGRAARRRGDRALARWQRARLTGLVRHARTHSPFYRHLYRQQEVPADAGELAVLPVTDKRQLMDAFDDWVCDPALTLAGARTFADDPAMIGRPFLDRYTLTVTSGTTGRHGIFVQDADATAIAGAMMARALSTWLTVRDVAAITIKGVRLALVVPEGGHFATTAVAARLRDRRRIAAFSVHQPLAELIAGLNAFRPAVLAPYASIGSLLAGAAETGQLHIDPVLVVLAAEGLPGPEYGRIARALGAKVRTSYAANECPFLSYSCTEGWLHVNTDWAILEPVDERYRPVPAGQPSHTVLLTNLANHVQPILRYDLGDSVLRRPDPCPCGQPGPAIQVQGRAADLLTFPGRDGAQITLAPLPLATLLESVPGLELFQIVQTGPAMLRLRLQPAPSTDPDALGNTAQARMRQLLDRHHLGHVRVERATEPPQHSAGGKVRTVIPYASGVRGAS